MKKWYEIKLNVLDYYLVLQVLNILSNLKVQSNDIKIFQISNCISIYFYSTELDYINADRSLKNLKK